MPISRTLIKTIGISRRPGSAKKAQISRWNHLDNRLGFQGAKISRYRPEKLQNGSFSENRENKWAEEPEDGHGNQKGIPSDGEHEAEALR